LIAIKELEAGGWPYVEMEKTMSNQLANQDKFSRRGLFHVAAVAACSLFAVIATAGTAIAKMAQKAAGYQDKPKDDQKCSGCALFKAPDSCTLVDGSISADGWCRFYSKKAS